MHEHFERQCDCTPDRIAVRSGASVLRYSELEARANRIAHLLRRHGVHRGALVGIALDRDADMLAGLLGVLKAGAGYVPLDPQFPQERLAYMAADAGLAALLTNAAHAPRFDLRGRPVLALDALADELAGASPARLGRDVGSAGPEDIAYVIYTSGSTGRPKGVQVPHRAVANFIVGMQRAPGITGTDRLLAVTTLSFDIAVLELLLPLSVGAEVVIADRDTAVDGAALRALVDASQATMMQATPSTWRMLIDSGWTGGGITALCGGEPLAPDLAGALLARCRALWNLYGPTETTVWSTVSRVTASNRGPDVHIGRPTANTRVWILDPGGELCPLGVPGEIHIGGEGVALGYFGRADLTAEKFIPDRFADTALRSRDASLPAPMLYRTGDRGRWRDDGNLEHLGRLDHQVKVRGFRIELGEIEANLAARPEVGRAVAIVREDHANDQRLVAYVVPAEGAAVEESALRAHLRDVLPPYMVPQHIVALEALPLLPNGKLDRNALPQPGARADAAAATVERHDAEGRDVDPRVAYLAGIWSELLGTPAGPGDNFFEIGGHSMLGVQMANRVARDTGVRIKLIRLGTQTLAELAADLPPMGEHDMAMGHTMGQRLARRLRRLFGIAGAP
jgi:amino acid adenylation domain-containing protein